MGCNELDKRAIEIGRNIIEKQMEINALLRVVLVKNKDL